MIRTDCPKIGGDVVSDMYELNLSDYLLALIPPPFLDVKKFDPAIYFITSGDAIQKSFKLRDDLRIYILDIRRNVRHVDKRYAKIAKVFEAKCLKAMAMIRRMIKDIYKARGDAVFMETEWLDGKIICCPKNPRAR
jgi:hypothetical protein